MSVSALRLRENLSATIVRSKERHQQAEQFTEIASAAPVDDDAVAVYGYLGDMLMRFMFTSKEGVSAVVKHSDMQRLKLTPELAATQVIVNARNARGTPRRTLFGNGVYQFAGRGDTATDTDACYFLDRLFWSSQLQHFPHGLVAAVPRRDRLFFVDAGDSAAIEELTRMAVRLRDGAGEHQVSGFMYIFREGGWEVFATLPVADARPVAASVPRGVARKPHDDFDENELPLALVASGQKMVIYCILANFMLSGIARSGALPPLIALLLYIAVAIVSLFGIVRMCSGLGHGINAKIVFMVLACVPLANLVTLAWLSMKATRRLRDNGWSVGLLGVKT